ncbi:MAG: AMP-binding protein, partial [Hyphomicrobiales bacterium]|nr:AMP-binding protein [Hyphomicrobiales bacterium]
MHGINVDTGILSGLPEGVARSKPASSAASSILRGPARPEFLRDETLAEIFAATVAARPDALCMTETGRALTYAQVDAEAEAIARGLVALGARPGAVVGLWMERGVDLLLAQLAIAKTGAAWLPFDADAPAARVAECLADAASNLLVIAPAFAPRARGIEVRVVSPAEVAISAGAPVDARAMGANRRDAAYVIYTSGSTGKPKGIVVEQANICQYLRAAAATYGIDASDVA